MGFPTKARDITNKHRTLSTDIINKVGKEVALKGWVHKIRNLGKIAFVLLRDRKGIVQLVVENPEIIKTLEPLQPGTVIYVLGRVQATDATELKAEVLVTDLYVDVPITEAPPIKYYDKELKVNLDTELDYRPLAIRNPKKAFIFKVQADILQFFREALRKREFTEYRPPVLMPTPSESGADVFEVNFFDERTVYLAQSPQFYKQIMLGAFERVFSVIPVFRAEKHNTARHLLEITQMDAEMAFIDTYFDAMDVAEEVIREIMQKISEKYSKDFEKYGFELPRVPDEKFPIIKVSEALQIIEKQIGKSAKRSELDLDPEDERVIAAYVKDKYNSDFVWIVNFKAHKNLYTCDDPDNPGTSASYDMLFRGLEILSGTWRIHKYEDLKKNIEEAGHNLENYKQYLMAFKYGMPKEAGWSFGLERITKQLFGLKNIREATLFPADLKRVAAQRLPEIKK